MNDKSKFRFSEASFDFGDGTKTRVQLVAGDTGNNEGTHITLLMGANGTCKSRLLSSCVDMLSRIEERQELLGESRSSKPRRTDPSTAALHCANASFVCNGNKFEASDNLTFETAACLPSRFLAIANLVRDRFTFVDRGIEDKSRYYYLGVRQSSNLTTTGAMDRIAADAFLNIIGEKAKTETFASWVGQLFPECQLGVGFEGLSPSRVERFLSDPEDWIKRQFGRMQPSRWPEDKMGDVKKAIPSIERLFQVLQGHAQEHRINPGNSFKRAPVRILQPERMSSNDQLELGDLRSALSLAMSLRLIGRPSLMLNTGSWMDFAHFSSGEQNLLSTGARLVGYATPGSFIVIDEPEVSLNVAWQQRYIELIQDALVHAQGSHVLIASHSPYLVSDLRAKNATIVVVERRGRELSFKSQPSKFWGWGSEAILYEVLGLPSASNYHFSRELASVLKLIERDSRDAEPFRRFLDKCAQLDLPADGEPLRIIIDEINQHYQSLLNI